MKLIQIRGRWNTETDDILESLSIKNNNTSAYLKTILVNIDNIAFISDYEGCCCISYSALDDDCIITDVPTDKVEQVFGNVYHVNYQSKGVKNK